MIGFDNLAINHQLLLGYPFREMPSGVGAAADGEIVLDRAKPHHLGTLSINGTGAMNWGALPTGYPELEFIPTLGVPANWTWVEILAAAAADLDFTAGDFTLLAWIYLSNLAAVHTIMCYGAQAILNGGGYQLITSLTTPSRITFATCQGVTVQSIISEAEINASTWYLVGATRSGTDGKVYINGKDRTTSADAIIDPDTQTEPFHIGVRQIETTGVGINYDAPYEGYIAYPRVWGRELSALDHKYLFDTEKTWFGV